MVFQNIDNNITTIFRNAKAVNLATEEQIEYTQFLVDTFNDYAKANAYATDEYKTFIKGIENSDFSNIANLAPMFEEAAKSGEHASVSMEDCMQVFLKDGTKGFKNVSNILKTFNEYQDPNKQKMFATEVGKTNANLGKYLSTVKDGKASLIGYGVSLAGVTAKTVLATAATTLFNAAISFGISLLVQGLITAISDVIHREENLIKKQEELRESAKNLTSQYKSAKEEADKLNKSSGDLINRYAKLSQGVDALGNNVSLTNEEYEEYKELSNQIADDIPNLVKAYDTEGNAILSLRDNIDELKTAYQEAAKEKYSALLNSDDIKNALEAYSEFVKKFQQIDISGMGVGANTITVSKVGLNGMSNLDAMEVFEQLLKDHSIANISISNEELQKIFDDFNIEYDWSANHSNEQESKMYQDVSTALAKLRFEYSIYQASLDSLSNAILNIYDGFYKLPSELQTIANAVANNLPDSLTESLTGNVEEDKAKIAGYIYNVVDSLNNPETAEQVTEAYKKIFEITDKDLPIAETQKQVEHFVQQIMKSTGMEEGVVKTIFGLDNLDNLSNQLDAVKQRFVKSFDFSTEGIRENFFDGLLNELSGSEIPNTESEIKALAAAIDEVSQAGGKSTDVLEVYRKKISEFNGIDPEKYDITETTKNLQEAYNALIEFRRALSDYETTTADIEKSIRSMAETYKENAEVKSAAEKYFTTHTKEAAQDFLETYKNAYLTDQNNFNTWLEEKRNVAKANENDADAWDKFSASDFVEVFKDAYGIDLTNYTSYLDMKNKLTQQWLNDNGIDISKIPATSAVNAILKAAEDALNLDEIAAMYGSFFDSYTPYVPNKTDKKSSGSSNDATKEAFEKDMKDIEHLHNMGLKSDEEYYEALEKANEKHYKNSVDHESDYLSNIEKIYNARQSLYKDDADKQFDDLEDQYKRGIITAEQYAQGLHDLGQELYGKDSIYGGTEFAIKALEELDKKVKETSEDIYSARYDALEKVNDGTLKSEEQFIKDWTKLNDDIWKTINPKQWEENYNEIADYTQDFYKDLLDKGVLNPDQYKDKVQSFFYRLKSMGIDLGKNWLADALEIDDIEYDKLKESLSADGDRTLDDVLADAEKLSEKNIKLFSDDPETFRKNAEDIFKSVSESAKDALDKMLITPDEYLQIIDKWGDNLNISKGLLEEAKELSEDDYLDRWDLDNSYDENKSKDDYELRAKRIEYIYKLAKQLYGKNGQKNLKAYNALINQGLEDVESLVEDYYDAEIKKLEKINDEEEKRQKALELQLNLIKARQKLEEAKSQRNQLILENGVFRYDYDQEAVMSAQEDIAEGEKAILEQEREDQKETLENQKEETLKFFDSVGGKLDDFIDRVEKFLAGDKDAFKVNESKTDVKTDVEIENDNNSSDIKDKNIVSKITNISDVTKDTFNIAKTLADNFSFENLVRALGGNPTVEAVKNFKDSYNATLVGKQITPSTLPSNVTNNSSTTNNSAKTVNIGDIHLHLDLTVESLEDFVENKLEQFAQEVGDAFETEILRKMTSN